MQYRINAAFMQMYASLIDFSNEICRERSEEYNLILFGSYSEIHAGCSVCSCKEQEEECGAVVLWSLPKTANYCCFRSGLMPTEGKRT